MYEDLANAYSKYVLFINLFVRHVALLFWFGNQIMSKQTKNKNSDLYDIFPCFFW